MDGGTPWKPPPAGQQFTNSPFNQSQINYMTSNPGKIAPLAGGGTMNPAQQAFFQNHGYLAPHAGTLDQQQNFSQFYKPQQQQNQWSGTGGYDLSNIFGQMFGGGGGWY